MIIKLFEVRDRGTCIPVLAIRIDARDYEPEAADGDRDPEPHAWLQKRALLHRTGYGPSGAPYTIVMKLADTRAEVDAYDWHDRTMRTAHLEIAKHFDVLKRGAVVDVEFILGETTAPKRAEREETGP